MATRKDQQPLPQNKPLQFDDFPKDVRDNADARMKEVGQSMPERIADQAEKAKTSSSANAARDAATLARVQPHMKPRNVTRRTAANARTRLVEDSVKEAHDSAGSTGTVVPKGTGWYFEHHARVADSAEQNGYPNTNLEAHTGSAVMSPQNSPSNERAAIHEILKANAGGKVDLTPKAVQHLGRKGIDISLRAGETSHVRDLPTGSIGQLSEASVAPHVPTEGFDLKQVGRGGPKSQVGLAEGLVRGEVDPATVHQRGNDGVLTAGKVPSYDHNIRAAVPGSSTHIEYVGRVHDMSTRLDLGPEKANSKGYSNYDTPLPLHPELDHVPDDHILSRKSHTVEDTWMNSVTMQQPHVTVGKTSVHKAAGSGGQYPPTGLGVGHANATDANVLHAWNNDATRKSAASLSSRTGVSVPPVVSQEVPWTKDRENANKAGSDKQKPMSGEDYQTEVRVFHKMGRSVPRTVRESQSPEKTPRTTGSSRVGEFKYAVPDSALPGM